jgi:hypothetical protein
MPFVPDNYSYVQGSKKRKSVGVRLSQGHNRYSHNAYSKLIVDLFSFIHLLKFRLNKRRISTAATDKKLINIFKRVAHRRVASILAKL